MPLILLALTCAMSLTAVTPALSPDLTTPEVSPASVLTDDLYQAHRDVDIAPVATVTGHGDVANTTHERLRLDPGDYVVREDERTIANGRVLWRISFDPVDETSPSTFWIDSADLAPGRLTKVTKTIESLATTQDFAIAPDEDEGEVAGGEVASLRRHHAHRVPRGNFCISHPTHPRCCKSAVNYKLLAMGLIRHRVGGIRARYMASGLAQQGWKEVHCGAQAHPRRGMTCTYVGRDADHTETFDRGCWYYGSKCTPKPMQQSNRRCISCKVPG